MDPWDALEPDRIALADYLSTLSASEWAAQSWCQAWDVKSVAAHLLVPATKSKVTVFSAFLTSGFNLDKMNARFVAELSALSTDQIVTTTRQTAGVRSAPPGLPPLGVLTELMVHTTDIARAIDRPLALPTDHYVMALDYVKGIQSAYGCKKRIEGLTVRATDTDWSTGAGPVVEGPADLLLAGMTGRSQALASLSGDGVAIMSNR